MIHSIRKFLLINLLLSITITTTLTVVGNYILDQKDIQHHLDSLLSQSGLSFQALIGYDINTRDLIKMQNQLNTVPKLAKQHYENIENPFDYSYEDKFQFQIWDKEGNLLIHSANSPIEPLSNGKEGFSIIKIHKQPWRVFTTVNPISGLVIVVAERYDIRAELGHRIARDDIYIMLLVYPLLGLMIWIIVGKGLNPLKRVADEVAFRAPTYLEPVDLTAVPDEIKPLVDELNKLFLRLQLAFDREKRFSADAAHELRTPLAVLKTHAQVAIRATDDENRKQSLDKLITGVDRCTHVVQQLLTLARLVPEEGYSLEDTKLVNLHTVAIEEMTQVAPTALEKNIEISLECQDENISVIGNPTALGILLRNLIDNAIRYTPENSEVNVVIYETEQNIILQVIDNGPGIPKELRSRVFERFYRVLGTKQQGSGLGLAIVQQIAQLHHAQLKLDKPKDGTGLIVQLEFPKPVDSMLEV